MNRKPSCLTSNAQRAPSGTVRDGVGRQGSMKPAGNAGEGKRDNIRATYRPTATKASPVTPSRWDHIQAQVVAAADRARTLLGWRPQLDDLATIVAHALAWQKKLVTRNR
jgi:UDP-glucose 4-epimerase